MTFEGLLATIFFANAFVSAIVAWAASQRGRSGLGWFLISMICSPIIAGVLLIAVGPGRPERDSGGQWGTPPALSKLSDADLAIVQKHYADQRAKEASRRNLPPPLA